MDIYEIRKLLNSGLSLYDLELRAVSYSRVSTDSLEQLKSLQNQNDYFNDLIGNKNKWIFSGSYSDEGISGLNTRKREQFTQMIEDAKEGKFDIILTKEISRFSRNLLDSISITRELLRHNVGVLFINDNLNTFDPDSELRLSIMATLAQEESRKISTRVRFGYKRSIKNGVVLGNDCIYGYKKDNGKLVVVESEAEMIRKIYELYSEGNGVRKIANKLAEMGYKSNTGNPMGTTTIRRILENEKYKGYYVGGKTSKIDIFTNKHKVIDRDEWTIWKDEDGETVPQIIDEELWDKCNKLLMKKRNITMNKVSPDEKFNSNYRYSHILKCENCNETYWRRLYGYESGEKKETWRCKTASTKGKKVCDSPTIYSKDIDEVLNDFLLNFFKNSSRISIALEILKEANDTTNYTDDIKNIENKITNILKKKDKLLELSMEDLITNKEFQVKNDMLTDESNKLEAEINRLRKIENEKNESTDSLIKMTEFINSEFYNYDDSVSKLTELFISSIYVSRDETYDGIGTKINLKIKLKTGQIFTKSYIKYNRQTKGNLSRRDYIEVCTQSAILTGTNSYVIS